MNKITRRILERRRTQRNHARLKFALVFGGVILVTAVSWYHLGMKTGVSVGFFTLVFLAVKVLFDPRFNND